MRKERGQIKLLRGCMYYSVKTLLGLEKNVSQIAKGLKIDRKAARRLRKI